MTKKQDLEAANYWLQQEIERLQSRLSAAEKEKERLEDQLAHLQETVIEEYEQLKGQLSGVIQAAADTRLELQSRLSRSESLLDDTSRELTDRETRLSAAESQLASFKSANEENAKLRWAAEEGAKEAARHHAFVLTQVTGQLKRAEEALSRYADHDRVCDARENALYACTCGFVEMIGRVFPRRYEEGR